MPRTAQGLEHQHCKHDISAQHLNFSTFQLFRLGAQLARCQYSSQNVSGPSLHSKLENPGGNKNKTKTQPKHPLGRTVQGMRNQGQGSMREQDLNERPGEAPLHSTLENPGETKTKTQPKHPQGRTAQGTLNQGQGFNERTGPQ